MRKHQQVNLAPENRGLITVESNRDGDSLIDAAVATVNRIYVRRGLETARTIGEFLLEAFFDGEMEKFHDRGRKDVSFRLLAQREDLFPSSTFLYHSIAVVEQLKLLPRDVGESLSLSHHKLLLPITSPTTKLELAGVAVERGLTVKELNSVVSEIREHQPKRGAGGRPRLPKFEKALRLVHKALEELYDAPVPLVDLRATTEGDRKKFLRRLDRELEKLSDIRDHVEYQIGDMALRS